MDRVIHNDLAKLFVAMYYFSYLFLKCSSHLSHKTKLNIVTKAIEKYKVYLNQKAHERKDESR